MKACLIVSWMRFSRLDRSLGREKRARPDRQLSAEAEAVSPTASAVLAPGAQGTLRSFLVGTIWRRTRRLQPGLNYRSGTPGCTGAPKRAVPELWLTACQIERVTRVHTLSSAFPRGSCSGHEHCRHRGFPPRGGPHPAEGARITRPPGRGVRWRQQGGFQCSVGL